MKFLASRKIFARSRPKFLSRKLFFAAVMILFAVFTLLFVEARFIYRKTELTLEKERRSQSKNNVIPFSKSDLTPHKNENVKIIQSAKNVRALAEFQSSLFAATDGGLLQMNENGEILRHFTVLDGLPESDLTAVAEFQSKLFIGTRSKGLIEFDGEKFSAFRFENHETKSITALQSSQQKLLIGTYSGGLIEFDGVKFTETKGLDERIQHITMLKKFDSDLLVGTFDDGIWLRKNQIWKHFRTADGLFSNRIVGIEIVGGKLFVATDLGISETIYDEILQDTQRSFQKTIPLPTLSDLIFKDSIFYLTKDNGEIYLFSAAQKNSPLKKIARQGNEKLSSARFSVIDERVFLLTDRGIQQIKNFAANDADFTLFSQITEENDLTDNNISALAIDENERIWIGTFREGIDVFSANGKKLKHLETENIREINGLNARQNEVIASTSSGVLRFDANLTEKSFIESAVLPSRSVSQVLQIKNEKQDFTAVSTVKGLFFQDKSEKRFFSTINGLPANSVFSILYARDSLFAGTMSGLAQIEKGRITRVFKTSNSELKNNWISALSLAGDRIFIGTYGGGIFELTSSGEILAVETGKIFVNPNALFSDGETIYAGTLDGAWAMNLTTGKRLLIKDILPSATVLSIAADRENIYFGTTGGIARINRAEFKI